MDRKATQIGIRHSYAYKRSKNIVGYKSSSQKRPYFTYTRVHLKNVWITHMDKIVTQIGIRLTLNSTQLRIQNCDYIRV
jgi:hypothetical protein